MPKKAPVPVAVPTIPAHVNLHHLDSVKSAPPEIVIEKSPSEASSQISPLLDEELNNGDSSSISSQINLLLERTISKNNEDFVINMKKGGSNEHIVDTDCSSNIQDGSTAV